MMVVDARTELAGPDRELARLLQKTGKPLFLAVNKVDSEKQESLTGEFHGLGIRNIFPISAEHGRGLDDLLDAMLRSFPQSAKQESDSPDEEGAAEFDDKSKSGGSRRKRRRGGTPTELPTTDDREPTTETETDANSKTPTPNQPSATEVRVAIIGHPNVGKSTLLNRLTGANRAIVSAIPGTTRDAVDELVERDGNQFRFVDTAGIRRKGKTHLMAEKLSVVMARKHLEAADIALLGKSHTIVSHQAVMAAKLGAAVTMIWT